MMALEEALSGKQLKTAYCNTTDNNFCSFSSSYVGTKCCILTKTVSVGVVLRKEAARLSSALKKIPLCPESGGGISKPRHLSLF